MHHTDSFLPHSHDPWLVTLSVAMAILASYTALDLGGRVTNARGAGRWLWLSGGAFAMGMGVWSMHFIAMLAFQLPSLIRYDIALTQLSLGVAVLASALALGIVSQARVRWWHIVLGGLFMGAGIAGMHYIGMAAMRVKADLTYDPAWLAASVVIAVAASMAALWLLTRFRSAATRAEQWMKSASAILMGVAIAGMHYTGMLASQFTARDTYPVNPVGSIEISLLGGAAIAGGAFSVLAMALFASVISQQLARLRYGVKFGLVVALFVAPAIVILALFGREQITYLQSYGYAELYGTYYLRPAQALLADLAQHELALGEYTENRASYSKVLAVQEQIDAHLAELAILDQSYGAQLDSVAPRSAIEAQWYNLQSQALRLDAAERAAEHTRLREAVRALISRVGDTSFLILDPDLDTYYLMDAVLLRMPQRQQALAEAILQGDRMVATEATAGEARAQLLLTARALQTELQAMEQSLQVTFANDSLGVQQDNLTPALEAHRQAVIALASLLEFSIANPPSLAEERTELAQLGQATWQTQAALYTALSAGLEEGIQGRIGRLTARLGGLALFAAGTLLAALIFGLTVIRGIVRPLEVLADATRRLAAGDLGVRVNVAGNDEGSQLSLAFNDMARRLQISQTEIQANNRALVASAEVSRRLSTILDEAQLVSEVVEQVKAAFDYYHVHIYLYDAPRERLVMAGGTGAAGEQMLRRGHALQPGRGLVGRAAVSAQAVLVPDTARDAGWLPNPLLPETRAEIAVPIIFGDTVLGVLDVQHNVVNGLGAADADLLTALAGQVAIALQNARSYAQVEAQARRQLVLNGLATRIRTATTLEQVLDVATHELGEALQATRARARLALTPSKNGQEKWQ